MTENEKSLDYDAVIELTNGQVPADRAFSPDTRDGLVYVYDSELKLAVEVALVTGRPLLLRGEPGSGKSSFAAFVARNLNWRYYEFVVTARTQARDLMWTFDTIRRLNDAQKDRKSELNDFAYVKPGVLWWVLNRQLALVRGQVDGLPMAEGEGGQQEREPFFELNRTRLPDHAVLLIDEIDKADPDVPNNLLVPLGSQSFVVEETGTFVSRDTAERDGRLKSPLVIITTNEERALPQAFLRRCVVYELKHPDSDRLVDIAIHHFAGGKRITNDEEQGVFRGIAEKVVELRTQIRDPTIRKPSTAEFLDAIRACSELGISVESETWSILERVVMSKGRV
jgi:MoxR-like ATPase